LDEDSTCPRDVCDFYDLSDVADRYGHDTLIFRRLAGSWLLPDKAMTASDPTLPTLAMRQLGGYLR